MAASRPAEEAAIDGFPPLRLVVYGDWLLRFSGGGRRTANSATPLREPGGDMEALIRTAEALYRSEGQPAIFRIPSFVTPEIDRQLAARGYGEEGESCIIEGPLDPLVVAAAPFGGTAAVRLSPKPSAEWFAAMARLQNRPDTYGDSYRQIVSSIVLPAAFAEIAADDGAPAALAYGVIHRGMLCFESVVTDASRRRQGYSRRVLAALAAWGQRNGVTVATLQVEADNTPGRTLSPRAIGMTTELHRYHYRRAPG